MFTDLFDTVRFSQVNANRSKVYAEAILFHALLNGATPVFSLPQIFDSSLILEMGEDDNFIEAFHRGYLRVSLYKNVASIKRYLLDRLVENIRQQQTFRFSSMPFLNDYDHTVLTSVYTSMIKAITGDEPFTNSNLQAEHKETVDRYLRCISKINNAIQYSNHNKGYFLESTSPKYNLKELIDQCINESLCNFETTVDSQEKNDTAHEFIEICSRLLKLHETTKDPAAYGSRTQNYEVVESYEGYQAKSIHAVKSLINYCYNIVVASSIPDHGEKDILGLGKEYPFLIHTAQRFSRTAAYDDPLLFSFDTTKTPLTWETLNIMAEEIKSIQEKKRISWAEARQKYDSRQTWLPYITTLRSGAVTVVFFMSSTMLEQLPVAPSLGFGLALDVVWGIVSDITDKVIQKPSAQDVIRTIQSSSKRKKILKDYDVGAAFFIDP